MRQGQLLVEPGSVKEFQSIKGLIPDLEKAEILDWWKTNMGFAKGEV